MNRLFCGQNDQGFAINGITYRWPVSKGLTWGLGISRLGSLSDLDLKQMYLDIWAEIGAVVDFDVQYNPNPRAANFLVLSRRLDGPSGVLAQAGIPMPQFDATSQLQVEWDDSELYGLWINPPAGKIDAYRVGLHEGLHWMGLGHGAIDRANPALIEPQYNPRIRHLQQRDKAELLRRYPAAKVKPDSPAAPAAPPSDQFPAVLLEQGGQVYRAKWEPK